MTRKIYGAATLLVLRAIFSAGNLMAQSDADFFAQGLAALKKYHDCRAARKAFESESQDARSNLDWLDYTAQAAECMGDLSAALQYYEREAAVEAAQNPSQGPDNRLIRKTGDLRYQLSKIQERQDAAEEAARLRQEQQQAEVQKRAELRADALQTLSSDSGRLVSLVSDRPQDRSQGCHMKSFNVSAPSACQLQTEEKDGGGCYGHEFYTVNFAYVSKANADGRGANVYCIQSTGCVSVLDDSHAFLENHIPNDTPRNQQGYSFQTAEEAAEAARLMTRIAAACAKQ